MIFDERYFHEAASYFMNLTNSHITFIFLSLGIVLWIFFIMANSAAINRPLLCAVYLTLVVYIFFAVSEGKSVSNDQNLIDLGDKISGTTWSVISAVLTLMALIFPIFYTRVTELLSFFHLSNQETKIIIKSHSVYELLKHAAINIIAMVFMLMYVGDLTYTNNLVSSLFNLYILFFIVYVLTIFSDLDLFTNFERNILVAVIHLTKKSFTTINKSKMFFISSTKYNNCIRTNRLIFENSTKTVVKLVTNYLKSHQIEDILESVNVCENNDQFRWVYLNTLDFHILAERDNLDIQQDRYKDFNLFIIKTKNILSEICRNQEILETYLKYLNNQYQKMSVDEQTTFIKEYFLELLDKIYTGNYINRFDTIKNILIIDFLLHSKQHNIVISIYRKTFEFSKKYNSTIMLNCLLSNYIFWLSNRKIEEDSLHYMRISLSIELLRVSYLLESKIEYQYLANNLVQLIQHISSTSPEKEKVLFLEQLQLVIYVLNKLKQFPEYNIFNKCGPMFASIFDISSPFTKSNLTINSNSIIKIEQQLSFDFGRKIIIS